MQLFARKKETVRKKDGEEKRKKSISEAKKRGIIAFEFVIGECLDFFVYFYQNREPNYVFFLLNSCLRILQREKEIDVCVCVCMCAWIRQN